MCEWETIEATCSKIFEDRNCNIPKSRRFLEASLTYRGEYVERVYGGTREKLRERARAFNKVLWFFSLAASSCTVRRECLTAAAESHAGLHTKLNFPAYRGAIFLPLPCSFRRENHRSALISPLHSFPSANSSSRFRFPSPHHPLTPG